MIRHILVSVIASCSLWAFAAPKVTVVQGDPKNRVTSIYLSEHFINEQIQAHSKASSLLKDLKIELDPQNAQMFLRGTVQIPLDEMRALNLDPKLSAYKFQLTIKPEATKEGYLILDFPLNETFFYPAYSKHPARDRVIVPTQMLSLALASARGYFAALSGDFSEFDRRTAKLNSLIKALDHSIAVEKNSDALDEMKTERDSLKLKLAAIPLERKQMAGLSKEVATMMAFTGEKELNLNDEFAARKNALILKINIGKFVPYLDGVMLGGIRLVHDKKDGPQGENYFSVDINANLNVTPADLQVTHHHGEGLKTPPAAMIRINEALFESDVVLKAEKKAMGSNLQDLKIEMKQDGLHVSGKYKKYFLSIPFDTIVDFDTAEDEKDAFDISVRDIEVAGIDLEFMTGFILEALKYRLDRSLHGICTFEYIGEQKDDSRALRVHIVPEKLIPALPGLHLMDVEVRDREFLLKVGKL